VKLYKVAAQDNRPSSAKVEQHSWLLQGTCALSCLLQCLRLFCDRLVEPREGCETVCVLFYRSCCSLALALATHGAAPLDTRTKCSGVGSRCVLVRCCARITHRFYSAPTLTAARGLVFTRPTGTPTSYCHVFAPHSPQTTRQSVSLYIFDCGPAMR
jgi:hypothetical protein